MFSFFPIALTLVAVSQPGPQEATATGTFDVTIAPNTAVTGPVSVLEITKAYHGALDGTGAGQMAGSGDPDSGTASYVVLEQVTGTIGGRRGGFTLLHNGWMHGGRQEMNVRIAPGSGTGALAGISGSMEIDISGGVHRYTLRYRLPPR